MIGRIGLIMVVFSAALFFVGCTGEQTQSNKQSSKQQQPSEQGTSEPTAKTTTTQTETAEAPLKSQAGQADEVDEEALSLLPEEVLALQYEYINSGAYQSAYSLFDTQSKLEVSLGQYRAYFLANAPYSVTDYSFSESRVQGDSASVDATFTANSGSGAEQLQRTQEFVRESGEWRVVMRAEQVAAFTAISSPAPAEEKADQEEQEDSPTPDEDLRRRLAENRATMEEDMAKRREAQAADMQARQDQLEEMQDQRDARAAERKAASDAEWEAQKKQRDAEAAERKAALDAQREAQKPPAPSSGVDCSTGVKDVPVPPGSKGDADKDGIACES